MNHRLVRAVFALPLILPATLHAQTVQGLENFSLPSASATPVPIPDAPRGGLPVAAPAPGATPIPRRTPAARPASRPGPTPKSAPVASVPSHDVPNAAASLTASQVAVPTVALSPTVIASAAPAPVRAPAPAGDAVLPAWVWLAGLVLLAGLVALVWRVRARQGRPVALPAPALDRPIVLPEPASSPAPTSPRAAAATPARKPPRARVHLSLRPLRAGLNMLSTTAECEITLLNSGAASARDLRLDFRLLSAYPGLETDLAAARATPLPRPAAPRFTLAPGEERRIRAVAALPRDAIRTIAGDRPMFVPIALVVASWPEGEGTTQVSQAFAIGIERVDSSKLAPFRLDQPPRMYDQVAAREHSAAMVG